MIDSLADWLSVASAALAGVVAAGGLGILAVRFLGANLVGHWLARALAKYAAEIETAELRKRVVSERLDRERSETINMIMEQVANTLLLMLYPPLLIREEAPEKLYLLRYGEIQTSAHQVTATAVKSSHRFGNDDSLVQACLNWAREVISITNPYYDALALDESYFHLDRAKRIAHLSAIFASMQRPELPAHSHLISVCRQMYAPVG